MFKRIMLGVIILASGMIGEGAVLTIIANLFPESKKVLNLITILISAVTFLVYIAVVPETIGVSHPGKEKRHG